MNDPIPAYVDALLAAEREAPRPSRAAEDRVRARVAATVVAAGAAGAAGVAAASPAAGAAATVKAGGIGLFGSAIGVKTSLIAVAIAGAAAVGGGVVVHQRGARTRAAAAIARAERSPRTFSGVGEGAAAGAVAPPAPGSIGEAPPTGTSAKPVLRLSAVAGPAAPRARHRQESADRADPTAPPLARAGLTEENVPIAAALAALARGAPADAVAALEEHARRFPDGQLAEEREALWIQALVGVGDGAAARARAERFRRRFPGGIQQEAVSAALEKIQ